MSKDQKPIPQSRANKEAHLTRLLEKAATGKDSDRRLFFETLLNSQVYIPLQPGKDEEFLVIEYEQRKIIPFFTEEHFVETWAEQPLPTTVKDFHVLLWRTAKDTWLYLNPAQETGKELSPWEIEMLRTGRENLPELLAELETTIPDDLALEQGSHLYPELKHRLRALLEVYPEVEEAFFIRIKAQEGEEWAPLLFLRVEKHDPARLDLLRDEIISTASSFDGEEKRIIITHDLNALGESERTLLSDSTPFYMRRKPSETSGTPTKNSSRSWIPRFLQRKPKR